LLKRFVQQQRSEIMQHFVSFVNYPLIFHLRPTGCFLRGREL